MWSSLGFPNSAKLETDETNRRQGVPLVIIALLEQKRGRIHGMRVLHPATFTFTFTVNCLNLMQTIELECILRKKSQQIQSTVYDVGPI